MSSISCYFSGALSIDKGEVGDYPLYNQKISCTGCEHSLTECDRSQTLTSKCINAATVTCKGKNLNIMLKSNPFFALCTEMI